MGAAKILVIEDNPSEVFLLRRALSAAAQNGVEVESLNDGEDALEFIVNHWKNREDFQPCVIVLDLRPADPPRDPGVPLLRRIRTERDQGPPPPPAPRRRGHGARDGHRLRLARVRARRVGADRVYSFEANPALEPLIRRNYELNHLHPTLSICILGEEDGEADFYVHDLYWISSTRPGEPDTRHVRVPTRSLNDEIRRINPTCLVMDIEGSEKDLIRIIDFHNIRKIAMGLHTEWIGRDGLEAAPLARLRDAGFTWEPQSFEAPPSNSTPGGPERSPSMKVLFTGGSSFTGMWFIRAWPPWGTRSRPSSAGRPTNTPTRSGAAARLMAIREVSPARPRLLVRR